jgi:hypothetical protein
MRCTRCDRPAIPQAIGYTPGGILVFGWCLDCLEETGCTAIEIAEPRRAATGRASMRSGVGRSTARPADGDQARRRGLVAVVASIASVWALVLTLTGVWIRWRRGPVVASPFGNGMPNFFLVGGGTMAATSLLIWTLVIRIDRASWLPVFRLIRWSSFAFALMALALGIYWHDPRHDSSYVLAAGLGLGLATLAGWRERQLKRPELERSSRTD